MIKNKHIKVRLAQCDLIASLSPCPMRKVGALIIDPSTNVIISEGYNGTPRGSKDRLCGSDVCERESKRIISGSQNDLGCHHAELNAILNATRTGNSTLDKWIMTNCDPCLMCAKAIHHAGIVKVYCPTLVKGDHQEGLTYLIKNGVTLISIS